MRRSLALALLVAPALLAACGPTCQSTCRRFYEQEQCDALPEGLPREDAISQCYDICQDALQNTGPAITEGDRRFNPELVAPPNVVSTLETEQEVAAWVDCVWSFSDDECHDKLDDQYCVKIF